MKNKKIIISISSFLIITVILSVIVIAHNSKQTINNNININNNKFNKQTETEINDNNIIEKADINDNNIIENTNPTNNNTNIDNNITNNNSNNDNNQKNNTYNNNNVNNNQEENKTDNNDNTNNNKSNTNNSNENTNEISQENDDNEQNNNIENGYYIQNSAKEVLDLVNQARLENGLSPLKWNNTLESAAMLRAKEIVNKFDHTRPDGTLCFTAFNVDYNFAGENIAGGQTTAKSVFNSWMNSPEHRDNILDPDFTEMSIGLYYSPNTKYTYYWAQLIIGK